MTFRTRVGPLPLSASFGLDQGASAWELTAVAAIARVRGHDIPPMSLMLLGLLRHGIAQDAGPDTDWRDESRALTDEGRRRVHAAASGIARLGLAFDAAFTSPLTRCLQTAEIVGDTLGTATRVDLRLRPGLHIDGLIGLLLEQSQAQSVLVCGHQPDLSTVTTDLIGGWVEFKKGSLALIEVPVLRERAGHLVALYPPTALRRLGSATP